MSDDDAAFQKQATNLIDHRGSFTDQARAHPVQRLQNPIARQFWQAQNVSWGAGQPRLPRLVRFFVHKLRLPWRALGTLRYLCLRAEHLEEWRRGSQIKHFYLPKPKPTIALQPRIRLRYRGGRAPRSISERSRGNSWLERAFGAGTAKVVSQLREVGRLFALAIWPTSAPQIVSFSR